MQSMFKRQREILSNNEQSEKKEDRQEGIKLHHNMPGQKQNQKKRKWKKKWNRRNKSAPTGYDS